MSDENHRIWDNLNELNQFRVRADERMNTIERRQDDTVREVARSETRMLAAIEQLGKHMDENLKASQDGWRETAKVLSDEMKKTQKEFADSQGYERGKREGSTRTMKLAAVWIAAIAAFISLLAYLGSQTPTP